jgi:hypothetical protein
LAEKARLISNADWFNKFEGVYNVEGVENESLFSIIGKVKGCSVNDVVVLNISSRLLIYFCIAKALSFGSGIKIISVDLILSKPHGFFDKVKALALRFLFKNVDCFILYMKEWGGYKKYYGINDCHLKYIPFKVNSYEDIESVDIIDRGYLFSGGMSKRDYDTLFEAVDGLDLEVIVLLPPLKKCRVHGTVINCKAPSNTKIVYHDCNVQSWIEYMGHSRFVVIPISKDTISSTGISTYLVAMALKKCVIISSGPATIDVIPKNCAVIVDPANPGELRKAISKVNSDVAYRSYIAKNGYDYAMSLKGHDRLVSDIVNFIGSI